MKFLSLAFAACSGLLFVSAAAGQAPAKLHFAPVPAEKSGLGHVLNSDAKLGMMKYPWMSPPVDIDGDGHLDLIVYGHHGGGAAVWLGKGDGTFTLDERGYTQRWVFGGRDPVWLDLRGTGAVDGIGTEGTGVSGWLFRNDGKGQWHKASLGIANSGIGDFQWADLDGDGKHQEIFVTGSGAALKPVPALTDWATATGSVKTQELWQAEKLVGWPAGIERGVGPGRAGYRGAFAVDLDGDDRNELILHFKGSDGFYSKQVFTWVLVRDGDGWKDVTATRGLPTGIGHYLFPEDIDANGSLDLVDLHTGECFINDGKGRFTVGQQRFFDPMKRLRGKGQPWTTDNELQWLDLDNNGYRDLVTASDHGSENGVFLNQGNGQFVEVDGVPGGRRNRKFGDVNGDQRLDMVTFAKDQLTLHVNQTPLAGLQVRLVPKDPTEAHLGAKLWVYRAGQLGDAKGLIHYRQGFMERDGGRSNVLTPRLHVGIGPAETVDIRVRFASGVVREARGAKAGSVVTVKE